MTIDSKQDIPDKEWQIEQIIDYSGTVIQHKTKEKMWVITYKSRIQSGCYNTGNKTNMTVHYDWRVFTWKNKGRTDKISSFDSYKS